MTARRTELRALAVRSRETVLLAGVVGAATGLGVALFETVTVNVVLERVLRLPSYLLPFAPLIGLAIAAVILRLGGRLGPATADEYIVAFHSSDDLKLRPLPWRMAAAVATLGAGAPGGLEGPSMYLGAGIGTWLQHRYRRIFGPSTMKVLMVAGAAAGVAAIFKAPATGAVFAIEVPYRDDLGRRVLIPSLVGASTGYLAFVAIKGVDVLIPASGVAPFDIRDLLGAAALGVGAGLVVRGFAALLRRAKAFQRLRPAWISVLVGGGVLAILTALAAAVAGEGSLALGPGYNVIEWLSRPDRATGLIAFILVVRLVGTAATLAGGGVVGVFVPLVVAGALLGRLVGEAIGVPNITLFVVVGIAAGLGAGYRVPLAAVMFVAEATGRPGFVIPGLIAAVGADLVMGDSSVTAYQKA